MRLRAAAAVVLLTAAPLAANEVAITFPPLSKEHVTVELRRVVRVADLSAAPAFVRETSLDTPVVLDLAPGTWAMDVRGAGVWHAQQTFNVAADHSDVVAKLWPAAALRGRFNADDAKTPVELRATFAPPDGGRSPAATVDCTTDKDQFQCTLPATTLDVRLRIRGYVTKFLWNQTLAAGQAVDAGALHFARGAVLLGRAGIGSGVPGGLSNVLVSATPSNGDEAGKKVALMARPESRGFFHLDGLPPGKYDVIATAGKYRSRAIPIVVLPGLTAEMQDVLRVEPPHTFRVTLNPPTDPAGRPWQVTLSEHLSEHHVEPLTSSRADSAGEWSAANLYPANYQLTIDDHLGSSWYMGDVEVGDVDLDRNVDLAMGRATVRVTFGGKPLHAQVSLVGGPSDITFETDEDGKWSGAVPGGIERWTADVVCSAPPVRRTVHGLRLARTSGSDRGELEIDLPNNAIIGTVVRKDGQKIEHALVYLSGGESMQSVQVDDDGSFFIAGMAAGKYEVSAASFLMESPSVGVTLDEGSVPDPVRLVLDSSTKIHGQVMSEYGPVAGAQVVIASTDVPQAVSMINMTDANGDFSTTCPPGAKEVDVFVEAPGFSLKFFHTHVHSGSLTIPVDQRGGRIVVAAPRDGDRHRPYLVHNGMWYPADALLTSSYAHQEGSEIVITAIDAGAYSLCLATDSDANAARHGILFARPCASAFLAPFGTASFGGSE